jgi:hypothetical protein
LQEEETHATPHGTFQERKRPQIYLCHAATMSHIIDSDPSYYEKEFSQPIWRDSMMEKYQSIMKNDVWDIFLRSEGKSVVTSKWIYKIKCTADGSIEKHKAIFVSRMLSHVEGIDYENTVAHIGLYTSIRMIISFATSMGWRLNYMDVKTTFLNGDIEEEVSSRSEMVS